MKEETIQRMTRLGLIAATLASIALLIVVVIQKGSVSHEEIQVTNIEPSNHDSAGLNEDLIPVSQIEVTQIVAMAEEAKVAVVTNNEFVVTIENFQLASPKK